MTVCKFAVISDIHGNLEGLEAVLTEIRQRKIEKIVCLGDVIGYGPDPIECWSRIKSACDLILKGNHESIFLGETDLSHCSQLGKESAEWTKRNVFAAWKDEFSDLESSAKRYGAAFYHAGVENEPNWPYLNQVEDILTSFREQEPLCFYGHTHRPRIVICNSNGDLCKDIMIQESTKIQFDLTQYRCYVNPGSVGQQRDTRTDASFAVCTVDGKTATIELLRIPYDCERTYRKLLEYGCGRNAAAYLIREEERRKLFENIDYRR